MHLGRSSRVTSKYKQHTPLCSMPCCEPLDQKGVLLHHVERLENNHHRVPVYLWHHHITVDRAQCKAADVNIQIRSKGTRSISELSPMVRGREFTFNAQDEYSVDGKLHASTIRSYTLWTAVSCSCKVDDEYCFGRPPSYHLVVRFIVRLDLPRA